LPVLKFRFLICFRFLEKSIVIIVLWFRFLIRFLTSPLCSIQIGLADAPIADLAIVLGSFRSMIPYKTPTTAEIQASKLVQKAWVSFAHDPARGEDLQAIVARMYGMPTPVIEKARSLIPSF